MSTDKFGLKKYTRKEKYNALIALVEKGFDRCNNTHLLTLPIFHAFSIKKEMTINKKKGKARKFIIQTNQTKRL